MNRLTISNFTSIHDFNQYVFTIRQIENEKAILHELMTDRERWIFKLHAYDGPYKGMALIADALRYSNKRIEQTKKLLAGHTKKYEFILRHFIK